MFATFQTCAKANKLCGYTEETKELPYTGTLFDLIKTVQKENLFKAP